MERIIIFLISVCSYTLAHSQFVHVNSDLETLQQLFLNTGTQVGLESTHNNTTDSIKSTKKKSLLAITAYQGLKELYLQSMQNIEGFGQESAYYKEIATTIKEIFTLTPQALYELSKRPYSFILCSKDITELIFETKSSVQAYVNIVNNAKVKFTQPELQIKKQEDNYNYLSRYDRLELANSILTTLTEIKYKLIGIIWTTQFCNRFSDYVQALDLDSWLNYMGGKAIVESIINDYKYL